MRQGKDFFFEKKKQKTFVWAVAVLFCGLVAACSSPDPTYYTLQVAPGAPVPGGPATIEIRRPGLAGYLDRSDVVLKSADYRLDVNSQLRWAEPLGDMIGRVLAQDLGQRLPGTAVFSQSGAITADPSMRVEVDILTFDADASGTVTLAAELAIERGTTHQPLAARHVSLTAQPAGPGAAAQAAAMSSLLGQLADQVAGEVRRTS
jgi:uncharacterized lipoprotein YmbA